MMLRRTTNCLSVKVIGSLKSKLSRKIGGRVGTSMIMLGYSQVRDFAAPLNWIVEHGRD